MTPTATSPASAPGRPRVPAAQRRDALIDAAVHEFAIGGLHGTPVERIARRVGVAQPYVFSLFASKQELFLAAVERAFELVTDTFAAAAAGFERESAAPGVDVLKVMGLAYIELLHTHRDYLLLQHQAYAACAQPEIREAVRTRYAQLVLHVQQLSAAEPEALDEFFRRGMWLNVAAALGVEDLSAGCAWVRQEQPES
jgi:AcrR family transcriptional regulator